MHSTYLPNYESGNLHLAAATHKGALTWQMHKPFTTPLTSDIESRFIYPNVSISNTCHDTQGQEETWIIWISTAAEEVLKLESSQNLEPF